jgi:hypothetical protein
MPEIQLGTPPPQDFYSTAIGAGFSPDEIKGSLSKDFGLSQDQISQEYSKIDALQPKAPPPPAATPAAIPPSPIPTGGSYSPQAERGAMSAAELIEDPAQRLRTQALLKQHYANERIADGIVDQARTQALNTRSAAYSKASYELLDSPAPWAQKLIIAKQLIDTMHIDPSLDYGNTKELLQEHMEQIFGLPNTKELGPRSSEITDAIADGRITTNAQILQSGQNGGLTHKGVTEAMDTLKKIGTADGQLKIDRSDFFKQYGAAIDPGKTALGNQRLYLAQQAAKFKEEELRKAGKNPADVYNPDSKDFFGTPENLARYTPSLQQSVEYDRQINNYTVAGTPVVPPPLNKPGQSPAPAAAPRSTEATLGSPSNPYDATGMTVEQIRANFGKFPGATVRLPDGRIGRIPYPTVSQ